MYFPTLNSCLWCPTVSCFVPVFAKPNPFGHLLDYLESALVLGCDGAQCIWQHQDVFSQELECFTGVCIDDISGPHT